ncbi:hypothetical protein GCM10020367_54320 [Streptomyces sannanensis]|uniref:Gfo/Idh/MocA-like oxidoreductase C-terminal domain-containing protein n=1 Tax=Streptomyces sannanensis TaxID=285536 RepID=A0ABP6SJR9_9ACTN
MRVWNTGPTDYRPGADAVLEVPEAEGSHGGADGRIIEEFRRFARVCGPTDTSPVAARMSAAAGVLATRSLREGGVPYDVTPPDPALVAYFEGGRRRVARGA